MKKVFFCIAAFATMASVNANASNVFDNPPQKQWGQTRVDESCRTQGVAYERSGNGTVVYSNDKSDVNMTVEKHGIQNTYSKDTRSNWTPEKDNKYVDGTVKSDDNVDIKCYPRNQK